MNKLLSITWLTLAACSWAVAGDLPTLFADRAAIERVYHEHRTGTKPPFEQALPPALLAQLVRADLKKETALARAYGVHITDAMVEGEVQRIDATTRAPEMLAEIKAALDGDPARFANSFARPIIVERLLREKFETDDKLHSPQRKQADAVRNAMLALREGGLAPRLAALKARKEGELQETVTWTLTPRPAEDVAPAAPSPTEGKASSSAYSNEATVQIAQVLSSPERGGADNERELYFEDLPGELRNVLSAQLRQPGDVSAIIESPRAFQVYLARERTSETMRVAVRTLPKRSLEEWLAQQPEP